MARYRLGAIAFFVLAATLPLFRQRGVPSWQTIWAEDGSVFFAEAHRDGPFAPIVRPYVGYLLIVPRLTGAVATLLPIRSLAGFHALTATVVTALLAAFVIVAAAPWISSVPLRVTLGALLCLMPAMGAESTATTTNLIWGIRSGDAVGPGRDS